MIIQLATMTLQSTASTYGSFAMSGNTWTYTLDNANATVQALDVTESITDSYTFNATDGSSQIVTVTIHGTEDAAVIGGTIIGDVTEDGILTASDTLTITDVDTSDNPVSYNDVASIAASTYGNFAMSGNTWTYTLDNANTTVQALDIGQTLNDTITFLASDGSSRIVTITINGAEDAPTVANPIVDQTATEDNAFSFIFAANTFNDVDGDTLTYTSNAAGWLLFDAATRTFSGTPLNGDVGTTTVTVTANDGNGGTISDTFDIVISNTNDAPTVANLVPDQTATEDTAFTFTFAANTFNDVDADALTYTSDASGWLAFDAATRTFSGTPLNGDVGTTTVTVTANDSNGGTVSDTFDIVISNTNDAAIIAGVDTGSLTEDLDPDADTLLEVSGTLTINDVDTGEANFNAAVLAGSYGNLTIDVAGNWNYSADNTQAAIQTLAAGATLTETISVSSFDGTTHNILITIGGVNDAPTAQNDTPAAVNEGGTAIVDLVVNDYDLDNALDLNSIAIIGAPVNGSLIVNGNGTVTYTHDGSETTSDSFSYTIADISGAISNTATVTITVNPLNDAPSAVDDVLTVDEGNSINIDLAANDVDVDNVLDLNSIVIVSAPVNGTLIVNGNGSVDYTHDGSETGSDSFTYTIADLSGSISNVATVNIVVNAVNDMPTTAGIANVTVVEDPVASSTINLNAAFDDADNVDSDLTYTITGNTSIGLFTSTAVNAATGELVLDYAADMNGSSQISLRATDLSGAYVDTLFTVTVTPVNDAPEVMENAGLVAAGAGSTTISNAQLNVNDIDNTNAEILYTITELPAHGELIINGVVATIGSGFTEDDLINNNVSYQSGGTGANDQFGFTVSDGSGGSITGNSFSIVVQLAEVVPLEPVEPEVTTVIEEPEKPVTEKALVTQVVLLDPIVDQGFKPIGGSSTPQQQQPVLTLEPVVEKEEVENSEEIVDSYMADEEREVSKVDFSTAHSYADIQVKAIKALLISIDKMKQEVSENVVDDFSNIETRSAVISGSGVALTAGVVAWVLRSGAVMASLLTSIPLWKGYDPLPLLVYKDDEEKEEVTEEKIPTSLAELKKVKALKESIEQQMKVDRLFGRTGIGE